jgi:D-glycero-D-manno-heptose 1,7-bisphosphate phosphatase
MTTKVEFNPHIWISNSQPNGPLIVFDRDDTLIVDAGQHNDPEKLTWMPGAIETLEHASQLGFDLAIATNQSGIGRGIFDTNRVQNFHKFMNKDLVQRIGTPFRAIAFCPHTREDHCLCRKPNPGLLKTLADACATKPNVFFGNSGTDMIAAHKYGIIGVNTDGKNLLDVFKEWNANTCAS